MNLSEKFASLTKEDKERLGAVEDMPELEAFLSEHGIELTGDQKAALLEGIRSGVKPIEDDELNAVAGGGRIIITDAEEKIVKQLAARDGRTINMPWGEALYINATICICNHKYKWGREIVPADYGKYLTDIKCYNCDKTWDKYYFLGNG